MDHLLDGYQRFRRSVWPERRATYEALSVEGQKPSALVIACSDSRVDPAMIFDAAPGSLFVVRNIANLVPRYQPGQGNDGTSAAVEFAVRALQVPHIVVLGHAQCGGVEALLHGAPDHLGDFVRPWIEIAAQVRGAASARLGEHETVRVSLANLMTFPWVRERVERGALRLHGMHYGIAGGDLERLDADGMFRVVEEKKEVLF